MADELARHRTALAASVKAYKRLQRERDDFEHALAADDSLARAQQARQQRADELATLRALTEQLRGAIAAPGGSLGRLDDVLARLERATERTDQVDELSERLRVAASQKVILDTRLAQRSAELDELRRQLEEQPNPPQPQRDVPDAERARLAGEAQQARAEAATLRGELDALRRQAAGFPAALERVEKLQRDLDQARKALDQEVQLRREESSRQEERVAELSVIVGAREEQLAQEREAAAQLRSELQRVRGLLTAGPAASEQNELARLARENKALEDKLRKLKAYVSTARRNGSVAGADDGQAAASASVTEMAELNTTIESQRRQLHAMTAHLESLRRQLAEGQSETEQLRLSLADAREELRRAEAARREEVAVLRNQATAQYNDLDSQFKLLRQRFDDVVAQKDAHVARLTAALHLQDSLGGQVNTRHQLQLQTDGSPPPLSVATNGTAFAEVYARENEQLLKSMTVAGLEQELAAQSEQIKTLQHVLADAEQQAQAWKALERILREEVQRLERMQRRETHNLEYLKNIVLQFVHANSARRKQLVPVLTTVLELSKEESRKLEQMPG